MNPFILLLLQAGINIANGHVKNKAGGEILDLSSFILDAAKAIDQLSIEETGQPLDWSKIRHHEPLGPPGEPELDSEIDPPAPGEPQPEFLGDAEGIAETPKPSVPGDPPPPDPLADDA